MMNLLPAFVILLFALLASSLYNRYKRVFKLKYSKVPISKKWTLFGNMVQVLIRIVHHIEYINGVYKSHPKAKYVAFFDGMKPAIMIRDPELIRKVMKNSKSLINRPDHIDADVDPMFGNHLFFLKGRKVQIFRAFFLSFFTPTTIAVMFDKLEKSSSKFVSDLSERVLKGDREIDVQKVLSKYAFDAMMCVCGGQRVEVLEQDPRTSDVRAMRFKGLFSFKFFLIRIFPRLCRLLKIKLVDDNVANYFQDMVKQTIEFQGKHDIQEISMIRAMLEVEEIKCELTPTDISAQCFMVFFGIHDTTSVPMAFILHEIAVHPEVQKRLQDEIDSIGSNRDFTYEMINEMPYLTAVIKEGLRIYAPGSTIDRVCETKLVLPPALPDGMPYVLEPGDVVWIPVRSMHSDSMYFSDPEKFIPDRFLDNALTFGQPPYMPYGLGPRGCIGIKFSMAYMKIGIIHLLRRFNLNICSKTCVPMKFSKSSITPVSAGGYWLAIEHRN